MKTFSFGSLMAACVLASCTQNELGENNLFEQKTTKQEKTISFSPFFLEVTHGGIGDIANWKTSRAAASRAGTLAELSTTLSYWDYIGDELIQKNTVETSAPLEMKLPYGQHDIYFLAHSSTDSGESSQTSFVPEKVTETFWTNFPLEVNNETSESQSISLDRVVSKAKITVKDAIPSGVRSMRMTVGSHYRTLDLKTGNAVSEPLPYSLSWELGAEYEGRTGLYFYIFTFTPTADQEYETSLKIEALSDTGEVLFSREANAIPLLRNRCTNVICRLFSSNAGISFSDPGDWEPELEIEI